MAHVLNITFEQQYGKSAKSMQKFHFLQVKNILKCLSSALSLYNHDRQVRSKRHFPLMNLSVEANKKYCTKKNVHQ